MIGRLFTAVVIAAAIYWYWTGPYQAQTNPNDQQRLEQLREELELCIRGQNFKADTGNKPDGVPEEYCGNKFNMYQADDDGKWYSHDIKRW